MGQWKNGQSRETDNI